MNRRHLPSIHAYFGARFLRSCLTIGLLSLCLINPCPHHFRVLRKLKWIRSQKKRAEQERAAGLGWKGYGGKHHESRFTKVLQGWYLPMKFCFDKRWGHLFSMINTLVCFLPASVIASDFPLWRKIVTDTGCGLLVDPSSPAAIAEAMRRIIADPVAAQAMGERGRRAVLDHFSWESESPILLRLYERLAVAR